MIFKNKDEMIEEIIEKRYENMCEEERKYTFFSVMKEDLARYNSTNEIENLYLIEVEDEHD